METDITPDFGLVDFHTHILPGMDDGSPDLETSVRMLENLKRQGVTTIVLTPHFYTDRESPADFLARRGVAFAKLLPEAERLGLTAVPACELYFTDYIFNSSDLSPLCAGPGYLLTEMPYACEFSERALEKIARLRSSFGVTPVLAHIERYAKLMEKPDCLSLLVGMGCLAQMNLDSLAEGPWQRRILLDYIKGGLVHVVGTDCHNMTTRPPDYLGGMRLIGKKAGKESADRLAQNAARIIAGEPPT